MSAFLSTEQLQAEFERLRQRVAVLEQQLETLAGESTHAATFATRRIESMAEVLHSCWDYMDRRADTVDGSDGAPLPNTEAILREEIGEVLE